MCRPCSRATRSARCSRPSTTRPWPAQGGVECGSRTGGRSSSTPARVMSRRCSATCSPYDERPPCRCRSRARPGTTATPTWSGRSCCATRASAAWWRWSSRSGSTGTAATTTPTRHTGTRRANAPTTGSCSASGAGKIYAIRVTSHDLSGADPNEVAVLSALRRRRPPEDGGRPREAVVLSGGGSLGAVQIGALRALLEAGVKPDLFVGCSVGALNAAALAVDPTLSRLDELEQIWRSLDRKDVFAGNRRMLATHIVRGDDHLYEPDALRALVRRAVPVADLGETTVACHVVTTDLQTGRPCWWTTGDPVAVLTASAGLPAVSPPVPLAGGLHVDGGVTCPVPTDRALDLGAMRTWVLDVTGGSMGRRDERMTALDVLLLSFAITRQQLDAGTSARAGQRIARMPRLDLDRHELRDFSQTAQLVEHGYTAMSKLVAAELAAVPSQRVPG